MGAEYRVETRCPRASMYGGGVTDRRGTEGFSVAPQRIGGGRGRGPWRGRPLRAVAVLAVGLAIVGIAFLGPHLSGRPYFDIAFFATPVPSPTPTPSGTPEPIAFGPTSLPAITRNDGGSLTGHVAAWSDGLHVLDLGEGTVNGTVYTDFGRDVIVPAPDGDGWWCVCMQDMGGDEVTGITREVQLLRVRPDGTTTTPRTITTLGDANPALSRGIQTDVDLAPDGRSGMIAVGRQTATAWEYSVARLDLVGATIGPWTALGRQVAPPLPTPTPSPNPDNPTGNYVSAAGPYVRLSRDGSQAVVWSQIQQVANDTVTFTENVGWRIPIDAAGNPGEPSVAKAFATFPEWCPFTAYARDDRLVVTCFVFPAEGSPDQPTLRLMDIGSDGAVARQVDVPQAQGFFAEPLLDTANGVMWLWDSTNLTLIRVDTSDLTVTSTTFDPLVEQTPGVAAFRGAPPVWDRVGSAVNMFGGSQMTGSPDGKRLFLLGYEHQPRVGRDTPGSLGVFVVDPSTLGLVERWAPAAYYSSIETVLGGKVVAASGQGGMDADGQERALASVGDVPRRGRRPDPAEVRSGRRGVPADRPGALTDRATRAPRPAILRTRRNGPVV